MKTIVIEGQRTTYKEVAKILDLLEDSREINEIVTSTFVFSLLAHAWAEENNKSLRHFDKMGEAMEYADSIIFLYQSRLIKKWAQEANLKIIEVGHRDEEN